MRLRGLGCQGGSAPAQHLPGLLTTSSVAPVVEDLKDHFFNDRLWPGFSGIPTPEAPVLRPNALRPRMPHSVELDAYARLSARGGRT
jgi:hypothetical protein